MSHWIMQIISNSAGWLQNHSQISQHQILCECGR